MKNVFVLLAMAALTFCGLRPAICQPTTAAPKDTLPIRGFCITAPMHSEVDSFVTFIHDALVPREVNTLILLVDYDYEYKSHPELADSGAMSERDAKKIVKICKENGIKVVPEIDLLGHQSWAGTLGKLLEVYPQFDETPWIKMPEHYVWPNSDNLYCKSYCPEAPGLHKIIFALIDELCDVFETNAFHAGMDEVFYIAMPKNPLDGGMDPSRVFADEVRRIDNHLESEGRQMWMWGDRFLDGKTTGLGEWEASMNNTYRAVDMIPNDIVICDWHYEHAAQTPVYFAMKGFHVVSCPFRNPQSGVEQVEDMYKFRQRSDPVMKERYDGIIQTVWSKCGPFLKQYYEGQKTLQSPEQKSVVNCFDQVFSAINKIQ